MSISRLLRLLVTGAVLVLPISVPAVARADTEASVVTDTANALALGRVGDWSEARRIAAGARSPLVAALVVWVDATRQPTGGGSFEEITGVIIDHPDWPRQHTLRKRAELALDGSESDAAILGWFDRHPPVTLAGALRYVQALQAAGKHKRAAKAARNAWINTDAQTVEEEDGFYAAYADLLINDDTVRRLDRLLWAGRTTAAERLLVRVDNAHRAVASARIALRRRSSDAETALAAVPDAMRSDPGLIYEHARWLRRSDNDAAARQLLIAHPVDAANPDLFWGERSRLARSALTDGNADEAYRVVRAHGIISGSEFADAEWLAGWIALRFLQQPDTAARHFLTMFENVSHPVSRARGAYWSARAAEQAGDHVAATLWHRAAAQHGVAFYGQLSAAEIRPNEPLVLPPEPSTTSDDVERFQAHALTQVVRLLAAAGETDAQPSFVLRLAAVENTPGWKNMTATLATQIRRPDLAVAVARKSVGDGRPLMRNGYPITALPDDNATLAQPVETPLIFAVIRQESAFNARALSPAGAQGLMQLMPGTARTVATKAGVGYAPASLVNDPEYNISLGRAYLGSLLSRFDGSYVLSLAAYNAGPNRVDQWLQSNGDPRIGKNAAVDWIELIPFNETRNYVQRCLESLQVYRARTGSLQLAQTGGLLH